MNELPPHRPTDEEKHNAPGQPPEEGKRATAENIKEELLSAINHTLNIIEDSGFQDSIQVKIYVTHLKRLESEVLSGRISAGKASQQWNEIDSDVQQVIALSEYNSLKSQESQTKDKPWWRRIIS